MATDPDHFQRLMVQKLTSNFREAVTIESAPKCHPKEGEICVKLKYVGINASDVNATKGRYFTSGKVPFGVGFEGVGEIVEVGAGVDHLTVGQSVAFTDSRGHTFAEYVCLYAVEVYPIPKAVPEYLVLLASGLTSSIGLDKSARMMSGETVLITAAAGGAGHIAVQWAKAANCHVIGTCSSLDKVKLLKDLGCDRVINYKEEKLGEVLKKEYPKGIDVIWETIGGQVFLDCLQSLATKGRLIVVGAITGYKTEEASAVPKLELSSLPMDLLAKSASVHGFLLLHYRDCFGSYFKFMSESFESGKLKPIVDDGKELTGKEFFGMEGIIRGVEHLHSGKSIGKVIARIS